AGLDLIAHLGLHLPEVAGDMAFNAVLAMAERGVLAKVGGDFLAIEMRLAAFDPALAFGAKGGALLLAEGVDALGFAIEEGLVVGQAQLGLLDAQRVAAQREIATNFQQFLGRDRIKADLVEEAQQPGLAAKRLNSAV